MTQPSPDPATVPEEVERALRERLKELHCLYRTVALTAQDDRAPQAICADVAALLPPSLLHGALAVARVQVQGLEDKAGLWDEPVVRLARPIFVEGRVVGQVEVGYRVALPDQGAGHGPFLAEEVALLDAVASHLGHMLRARQLAQALRQSERLSAVGELTGGIAHDFNNLLQVILGNAESLAGRADLGPACLPLVLAMRQAAERGADLTHRLLAFARRQALAPTVVELPALVEGLRPILASSLGDAIALEVDIAQDIAPAMVDPHQLEHALLNLCVNARDAMPSGGMVRISLTRPDPHMVALCVSDEGTGMAEDVRVRAFEPFFTTKPVGQGSGLGLSMVYGFARQSGGDVTIDSAAGQGTTVRLCLPVAGREAEPATDGVPGRHRLPPVQAGEKGSAAAASTGVEPAVRVLVVEDDELVRQHVQAQLLALGHLVETAADAQAALALLARDRGFDLLLTDVSMPGRMNGPQLAEQARRLLPGLPVLFTSGYPQAVLVRDGRLPPGVHLLCKPYPRAALAAALRQVLDEARANAR